MVMALLMVMVMLLWAGMMGSQGKRMPEERVCVVGGTRQRRMCGHQARRMTRSGRRGWGGGTHLTGRCGGHVQQVGGIKRVGRAHADRRVEPSRAQPSVG